MATRAATLHIVDNGDNYGLMALCSRFRQREDCVGKALAGKELAITLRVGL
jgi:hypothetical protein